MLEVEVLLLHYDNVKLQSEEERRSGRRYFRDVAVLVCFFSSFPLRLPSCSFWKQALLIPNRFTLNTIHLSCYCYHYSPHLNYRSPLDIHLHHFLDTRHYFLLHFHFPDHHFPAGHFLCFLNSLLDFCHFFLLFLLRFRLSLLLHVLLSLLLRSLRPLMLLLPVPAHVLALHIELAGLALVVWLVYRALNRWKRHYQVFQDHPLMGRISQTLTF